MFPTVHPALLIAQQDGRLTHPVVIDRKHKPAGYMWCDENLGEKRYIIGGVKGRWTEFVQLDLAGNKVRFFFDDYVHAIEFKLRFG